MNLPAIKVEDALKSLSENEAVKDLPEFQVIQGALKKDIVSLGTDEAFALRDDEGEIRAFRQRVTLSAKAGTLVQPVPNGPFVVSAQGYEVWAETAGACVIFPKEVLVGNTWVPNPHAERDPNNRRILAVHARAVAFRFSSKGIPQVSDWTTIYDSPSYRMIDLLAKAKKTPQAFKLLPSAVTEIEDKGTWASYPFDESTSLWVNTEHGESLDWYKQILNREKKAMDFAQTFAKRNALKHLSGLQRAPGNVWELPVLCWRPVSGNIIKWDATQYINLQDKVGSLITGNGDDFTSNVPQIERHQGKESVTDEDGFDVIESEDDPEDQVIDAEHKTVSETTEPAEKTAAAPPEMTSGDEQASKMSKDDQTIITNYNVSRESMPEEFNAACDELNINQKERTRTNPSVQTAKEILDKMNEIVDLANAE